MVPKRRFGDFAAVGKVTRRRSGGTTPTPVPPAGDKPPVPVLVLSKSQKQSPTAATVGLSHCIGGRTAAQRSLHTRSSSRPEPASRRKIRSSTSLSSRTRAQILFSSFFAIVILIYSFALDVRAAARQVRQRKNSPVTLKMGRKTPPPVLQAMEKSVKFTVWIRPLPSAQYTSAACSSIHIPVSSAETAAYCGHPFLKIFLYPTDFPKIPKLHLFPA